MGFFPKILTIALPAILLLTPMSARASSGCLLLISYPNGKTLHEEGDCNTRFSPASTFKLPLAVMGFDAGILKDEHTPLVAYKDEYQSDMAIQKIATDPTIWEKESIVWYSQHLTRQLGAETFKKYVDQFDYGNRDVFGAPGKNDGLTKSWLSSSLKISPAEQAAFLKNLLDHNLGVSQKAYDLTLAITPQFSSGDWIVYGKTGTGWRPDQNGVYDKKQAQGWFVGWAERDSRKVIFAHLIFPEQPTKEPAGPQARRDFLARLPALMADK